MSVLPNATFISPGNSFYGNGNNAYPPVINASTINAQVGNISTVNTTSINLDGQILTADVNDLLLNGVPIATLSNISSIADWSYYAAVSTVRMNNNDLSNVNNVYFQTASSNPSLLLQGNALGTVLSINGQPLTSGNAGNAANWSQYPMQQNLNAAGYDLTAVKAISATNNITGGQLNIFPSGSSSALNLTTDVTGTVLYVDGQPVATGSAGQVSQWSQFPASSAVNSAGFDINNTRQINVSSINTSTVNISGNGSLTTDSNAILLYNGSPVALQTGISSIADWYLYPALSSVQVSSGQKVYSLGELNVVGATLNLETSAQLNASTNSVLIADTGVRITGDAGIYLGANGGVQIGGLGGVSISAVGGVAVSAGALFTVNVAGIISLIAGGAINLAAIGAASLAATGPVNIGSVAYTSIEKIRINDNIITRDTATAPRIMMYDVQKINGNQTDGLSDGFLHIEGDEVSIAISSTRGIQLYAENSLDKSNPIALRADGTNGTGLDEIFYWVEQVFNPSSQQMNYTIGTDNITNTHAPLLFTYNSKVFNVLTGSTITNSINQNFDGHSTITYSGLHGVNINNVSNFQAGTINADIVNTNTLNLNSVYISSIQASSIVASTIATPYFLVDSNSVALGFGTLASIAGNNNVSIGNNAGFLNQGLNTVAVGFNAGLINQSTGSVAVGALAAGAGQNEYSIALGFRAANAGLRSNSIYIGGLPVGQNETFIENNAIVLNASGTPLLGTSPDAFHVRSLRQPPNKAGFYTVGYNTTTNEVGYTTSLGLNELSTTVANTQQIVYDGGLLTTTIDGLLTVNGDATFTQNVNMDTTLNVLQGITASTITTGLLNYSTLNPPLPSAQVLSQSGNNVNLSGGGGSVNIATTTQVATNTTKLTNVSYAGGNTTILGDLYTANQFVSGAINAGTNLITAGSLNLSQEANISSLKLYGIPQGVAPSALFYNSTTTQVSYAPITTIVAEPAFQVVATSATPIALNASVRGRTYLLTGTTTQPFTTTGLTATDAGFAVIVHNGNATHGGDINITGATGTTIIHNRTATANGGVLYLYWTGAALIGY